MQKQPGPFKVSFFPGAIFRDHRNPPARVVRNPAYPIAAAAKAPIALDPAERPRTIVGPLVPPWTTEEIIPAQLQPTRASIAGGVGPGVLQSLTHHRAGDVSGAAIGVPDNSSHACTGLGEYNFGVAKTITSRPPFPFDVGRCAGSSPGTTGLVNGALSGR